MEIIIFAISGVIIGSFLNAVIHRLPNLKSILTGRSKCAHCHSVLSALDLVPLISFAWLLGQCRHCGKSISWQYPVVELLTSICFILLALKHDLNFSTLDIWYEVILISIFIVIAVYDYKHYLILDKIVFPTLALSVIWSIFNDQFIASMIGLAAISGFFLIQYLFSRGKWIGLGDVKLGLLLGTVFGVNLGIIVLLLSYYSAAIIGIGLIAMKKKNMTSRMPFGTFLALSAIAVILYGEKILNWALAVVGF